MLGEFRDIIQGRVAFGICVTLVINALEPGTGVPIHRASLEFRDRSNLARKDLVGF